MKRKRLIVLILVILFAVGIYCIDNFLPYKKTICSIGDKDFIQTKDKCEKTGGLIGTNQQSIDFSEKMARVTIDPILVDDIGKFAGKISDQVKKFGYESGSIVVNGTETFQVMAPKYIADYLKSRNPEIKEIVYDQPEPLKVLWCTCPDKLAWDCERGCVRMNKNICLSGGGKWIWIIRKCDCGNNSEFVSGGCLMHYDDALIPPN